MTRREWGLRALTPAEKLRGICAACRVQPCKCAEKKEPGWIERLEREAKEL